MTLPLSPPIKPQLALTRKQLPSGEEWAYEPKLDGFRAIVFVDGEDFYIQSRGGKELARYFPELRFAPGRWVLDGELVIRDAEGNLEFDLCRNGSTRRSRGSSCSRARSPPPTSPSTCWPRARNRCWRRRWPSAGGGWRRSPRGRGWS